MSAMSANKAMKLARQRVYSDGANLLTERSDGQVWSAHLDLEPWGTRNSQIRRAVAKARRRYAESLPEQEREKEGDVR